MSAAAGPRQESERYARTLPSSSISSSASAPKASRNSHVTGCSLRSMPSASCSSSSCLAAARHASSSYAGVSGFTDWPSCAGSTAGATPAPRRIVLGGAWGRTTGCLRTLNPAIPPSAGSAPTAQRSNTSGTPEAEACRTASFLSARATFPSSEAESPRFGPLAGKSFARASSRRALAGRPAEDPATSMVNGSPPPEAAPLLPPRRFSLEARRSSSSASSTSAMLTLRRALRVPRFFTILRSRSDPAL
mmetsp:Transcript_65952/g.212736  ORF Transcript_65952/g.212736 Transcript_65952/m.212736 type:complete len:248 (+) Transcript_65952:790-1533(+)